MKPLLDGGVHWRHLANIMDRSVQQQQCNLSPPLLKQCVSYLTILRAGHRAEPDKETCSVELSAVFDRHRWRSQSPTDQAVYSSTETRSCTFITHTTTTTVHLLLLLLLLLPPLFSLINSYFVSYTRQYLEWLEQYSRCTLVSNVFVHKVEQFLGTVLATYHIDLAITTTHWTGI